MRSFTRIEERQQIRVVQVGHCLDLEVHDGHAAAADASFDDVAAVEGSIELLGRVYRG